MVVSGSPTVLLAWIKILPRPVTLDLQPCYPVTPPETPRQLPGDRVTRPGKIAYTFQSLIRVVAPVGPVNTRGLLP
jgi:hypothetical protein